jgi:membrane associated rhomboid family serine protease
MFIPIGHDGPPSELPWMTTLLIGVCTALHLMSSLDSSILNKVDGFCKSAFGGRVTDTLKDLGMRPNPKGEDCMAAVAAIITGKALTMVEVAPISLSEREDLRKLVKRAESQLDIWGWHAFQPKKFSLIALFTSTLFHADWLHLIGNMIFLWIFGSVLEGLVGPLALLGIFLGAGVFANLIYFVAAGLGLASGVPTLGASAGIYGILAGVWRKLPRLKMTCVLWLLTFVRTIQIPATYLIGFYILTDAFSLLVGTSEGINLIAHLAGFFFVFFLLEQTSRKREYSLNYTPSRIDITPPAK